MRAINPANGQMIGEYEEHSTEKVNELVARAAEAFRSWRKVPFSERAKLMRGAAEVLRSRRTALAELMTAEMGKTVVSGEAEADKCALVCDFYAEQAEGFLAPETIPSDAGRSFVRFDPLGPVLAVMPWNFPFWQVFRFAAPGLMAGNVGLLKHASNVPGCALAIEEIFTAAGFPEGVFTTLMISSREVANVVRNPHVKAATLTGSEPAGIAVAGEAGRELKKTVLELGGSDPFIVLADADLDLAADGAVLGRTINSGQSCIAAKRFIVVDEVYDAFEARLTQRMAGLKMGDPMDRTVDVGPLARQDLVTDLEDQVARSIAAGAIRILGGNRHDGPGYYYEPTVLSHVEPGMAAFDEETFGPVAALIRARDVPHAIELANLSPFGLGASIWTGDSAKGEALAEEIDAGAVFVNGIVKSDPRLPFGGVKRSGYGRELSRAGILEFVNQKTVWIK
jgi:succinate-semialdehyde dehydrogenase / glutarate-semialdehyde dehydrogenase